MLLLKRGSALPNLVKIPFRSENMDKMQTEFPRSGIFPRSGMDTPHRLLTFSYFYNPCPCLLARHTFYSGFENIPFRENGMYC